MAGPHAAIGNAVHRSSRVAQPQRATSKEAAPSDMDGAASLRYGLIEAPGGLIEAHWPYSQIYSQCPRNTANRTAN